MSLDKQTIKKLQKETLTWFAKHKRDLPWREVPYDTPLKQRDPYKIIVSEVMLQQTQIVLPEAACKLADVCYTSSQLCLRKTTGSTIPRVSM